MGYGLRNVDDRPRAIAELHRVLRPGASVAILDFNNSTDPTVDLAQAWFLDVGAGHVDMGWSRAVMYCCMLCRSVLCWFLQLGLRLFGMYTSSILLVNTALG